MSSIPSTHITSQQSGQWNQADYILNHLPIACYELDQLGVLTYINHKAEELFGLKKEEVIGQQIWNVFPELKGTDALMTISMALYNKESSSYEFFPLATPIKLCLTATPVETGAIITFTQIDNKRSDQAQLTQEQSRLKQPQSDADVRHLEQEIVKHVAELEESRQFIAEITSAVPDVISIQDVQTDELLYVNQDSLWKRSRSSIEQVLRKENNKQALEIVHPESLEEMLLFLKNRKQLAEGEIMELEYRLNDGHWIRSRTKPFKWDADGNLLQILSISTDITEQKKIEQELQDSKNLLQSVFDTSLIGMSILQAKRDENGNIRDFVIALANKELENLTGRTDLVGKLYAEEFPGIKQAGLFDLMLEVMATGRPAHLEYNYPHEKFHNWFSSMFVKLGDGLMATNLDITERKLAEDEKLKNFTLLQQSETLTKMGSWEYNLHTGAFIWSDGMYRLFNLENGVKVLPEIYLEYVTDKCRPDAERMLENLKKGDQDFEETLEINVDGHIKFIKLKATLIYNEHGLPAHVLGVDLDVTATKQAEQQILENAAMIQGIADAAPDMLYVINIRTMQMVYANKNVIALFNKTAEEIKLLGGQFFKTIIHPEDEAKFYTNIEALLHTADGEIKELTYRLLDWQGHIHWIKTRRAVYQRDNNQEPVLIIGISQDITEHVILQERNHQLQQERKEMEDRQRQEIFRVILSTQEEERRRIAESLHNGLGQTLYGVKLSLSHVKLKDSEQPESGHALAQTDHLLTDAIKESRRISHELMPSVLDDFGLKAAIEDICRQFTGEIDFKCTFNGLSRRLDKYIEIAVYRIAQEMMLNVVKHAHATTASVKVEVSSQYVLIIVEDNGIGFELNQKNRDGIGLRTVKNKVNLLDGEFSITSANSKGTRVNIRLPNYAFEQLQESSL
jgi:PAS domain S-box-containing protein